MCSFLLGAADARAGGCGFPADAGPDPERRADDQQAGAADEQGGPEVGAVGMPPLGDVVAVAGGAQRQGLPGRRDGRAARGEAEQVRAVHPVPPVIGGGGHGRRPVLLRHQTALPVETVSCTYSSAPLFRVTALAMLCRMRSSVAVASSTESRNAKSPAKSWQAKPWKVAMSQSKIRSTRCACARPLFQISGVSLPPNRQSTCPALAVLSGSGAVTAPFQIWEKTRSSC